MFLLYILERNTHAIRKQTESKHDVSFEVIRRLGAICTGVMGVQRVFSTNQTNAN